MDYTAKDIFRVANSFATASSVISERLSETGDVGTYIAPYITLASFAIELYLKCIHMIDNNKPAPSTHELYRLYANLSEESRIVIEMVYDLLVEQDPVIKATKEKVPEMKTDLDSVFKEISSAFTKWRYSYEKKLTGFPASGPLLTALKGRIKILKPEWFEGEA